MLKRLKFLYSLYNFFHKDQLIHNVPIYKKLGLNKRYYSPVSSKDFKNLPALSQDEKNHSIDVKDSRLFREGDEATKESILSFEEQGFAILTEYLSSAEVKIINDEIDNLLRSKKIHFGHAESRDRLQNLWRRTPVR